MDAPVTRRTLLAGLLAGGATAALAAPSHAARTGRTVTAVASTSGLTAARLGLASPGLPWSGDAFLTTSSALGVTPASATFFLAWSGRPDFPTSPARALAQQGVVPVLTWEPWDPAAGVAQPAYGCAAIASGAHDAYVTSFAQQVRAYGGRVVIRLMHEANGSWYPWAVAVNGNSAASYVAAWRRVQGIFAKVGATNAELRFCVNTDGDPAMPRFETFFPGDRHVGSVSVDGYNWGTTQAWSRWTSFGDLVEGPVARLRTISARPVHVDETGCTELGGSKAAWIAAMDAYLASRPQLASVTWFDFAKETDWRICSSQASLDAFRSALA